MRKTTKSKVFLWLLRFLWPTVPWLRLDVPKDPHASGSGFKIVPTHSGEVQWVTTFERNTIGYLACSVGEIIEIWTEDRKHIHTLEGHQAPVSAAAASPDGQTLASAAEDTRIMLWDTSTGRRLHILDGHILPVNAIAFSHDGQRFLTGSKDSTIMIWETKTGTLLSTFQCGVTKIQSTKFVSGSNLVAIVGTISNSSYVLTYDADKNTIVSRGNIPTSIVATAFASSSPEVAVICGDGNVRLWRIDGEVELIETVKIGSHSINDALFGIEQKRLICASKDSSIKVFEMDKGRLVRQYRGHRRAVNSVSLSTDGNRIVSGSDDGTIRLCDALQPGNARRYDGHVLNIRAIEFLPGDRKFVTCSYDQTVRLWDLDRGEIKRFGEIEFERNPETGNLSKLRAWGGHGGLIMDVAVDPRGRRLASAGYQDKQVILWDINTGESVGKLKHPMQLSSVAYSHDKIATGCWDDNVWLWDADTNKLLQILKGHSHDVVCVRFSPNGKLLVSGSKDHSMRVWNPQNGSLLQTIEHHQGEIGALAFSPDGRWLASGSADTTICLWKIQGGEVDSSPVYTLNGHNKSIASLSFNHDGTRLASTTISDNGGVRIWDTKLGIETAVVDGKTRVCFSPNGNLLAVCNGLSIQVLDGTPVSADEARSLLAEIPSAKPAALVEERPGNEDSGGLKILGYKVGNDTANGNSDKSERKATLLAVALSYPYSLGQNPNDEYESRLLSALAKGRAPPAPNSHSTRLQLDFFKLVLSDGRELTPLEWRSWPNNEKLGGSSFTFTSTERLTKLQRDVKLVYWELPDESAAGPFRVRIKDFQPALVPPFRLRLGNNSE